jgi:SOS response regulatory protein OraA/RecX
MSGAFEQALDSALRFLSKRQRFETEVRRHLSDFPEEIQDGVLAHLTSKGILNDRVASEALLRSYAGRRSVGVEALKKELRMRGAPEEVIETVQLDVPEPQRALCLLESRFTREPSDRARAGRMLFRRGFQEEDIAAALDAHFGAPLASER